MLPDFPKVKTKFQQILARLIDHLVRQEPLLSQIRRERQFEGNRMTMGPEGARSQQSGYKQMAAELAMERDEVIAKGPAAFLQKVESMAEQLQEQQGGMVLNDLRRIVERAGTVVDAKGRELTYDLFLEGIEKISMDFGDKGNPHLPTLFVSPEIGLKLKDKLAEWNADPEVQRKFREIIEKKRQEWLDRESDRKLVD